MISIITTCYNGARYIEKYAKSILSQNVNEKVEIVFVDDGSKDESAHILNGFYDAFDKKGITLKYIFQKNQGQASATNSALKNISGDFFMLWDIDDWMEPDGLSKRLSFLKQHTECGMVRSAVWKEDEQTGTRNIYSDMDCSLEERWIFDDVISGKTVCFPIHYLFRTECFRKAYPDMKIFPNRATQDVQVILPLAYYYKTAILSDVCGTYLVRNDSHSHRRENPVEAIKLNKEWEKVWINTINKLAAPASEKCRYQCIVRKRFSDIIASFQLEIDFYNIPEIFLRKVSHSQYVIFGSGDVGRHILKVFKNKGMLVRYFIDNASDKEGTVVDGITVCSFDDVISLQANYFPYIVITVEAYRSEIESQLNNRGLIKEKNYCFYTDEMKRMIRLYQETNKNDIRF